MIKEFNINEFNFSKYLFFTGKGGVGKTSTACATAIYLADKGNKVMLVSTDPASNLQDVFNTELNNKGVEIKDVPNLVVANFDPLKAASEYRESVIAPYRGKLPQVIIDNMEEQLSGSCTVEIAAFNEFSNFITDKKVSEEFDYIIFDTAPTGHTIRMLQLPSAWSSFISESTHGASCLGQLAGLEDKKETYKNAVKTLADRAKTTLILVARPDKSPLIEAERASNELKELGIENQLLIINGVLKDKDDKLSEDIFIKQQTSLNNIPSGLQGLDTFSIPLRPYNVTGIDNLRAFFNDNIVNISNSILESKTINRLNDVIEDLCKSNKRVIFTMGKGGVGKTTIAATIALGLSRKGKKVHLTTTDPAAHLKFVLDEGYGITLSRIDEKEELKKYQDEVLTKARQTMSEDDIAYVEEDLRSPCTQEIAVFRAFADIVKKSENEVDVYKRQTLKTMQKLRLRVEVKNNLYELSARLMSLLGYIGILFLLFKLLLNKDISVGVFAAIFSSIGDMYSLIEEAIVSRMGRYAMSYGKIKNYFEFMDLEEEQGRTETVGDGNIVFKNVTFRYPGCEVNALEDIAFTLNQGEKLAVVGANGSGKTTLAKVLTGIYTPVTGTVKSTSFENISQVFQKFQRYKMTLSDNVYISDCDKDKSEEKINISLKKAGININTSTYPEGVDTLLANEFGGVDISGGQWQKIAIARGFYRDSKLIVLDEPTSAIDPVEENAVYNRFEKMIKDKTAVIITHRLGAVRFADKILVMDKGKAVGFGSHDNLLENNSVYKEMWLAQAESYV